MENERNALRPFLPVHNYREHFLHLVSCAESFWHMLENPRICFRLFSVPHHSNIATFWFKVSYTRTCILDSNLAFQTYLIKIVC
jgi:hypothetical protein